MFHMSGVTNAEQKGDSFLPASQHDTVRYKAFCHLSE